MPAVQQGLFNGGARKPAAGGKPAFGARPGADGDRPKRPFKPRDGAPARSGGGDRPSTGFKPRSGPGGKPSGPRKPR